MRNKYKGFRKMANEYKAINLSQGFPDFNCSKELVDLVHGVASGSGMGFALIAALHKTYFRPMTV